MNWLEIYGYLGSVLIAVSLMMADIYKLRWINLVGAGAFASYGLLIGAWPVAALNGFIVLIDIVHLWQLYRKPRAARSEVEFQVADAYVQTVLVATLPQIDGLAANERIRVTFEGTQPVGFEVLEETSHYPEAEEKLAA